MESSSLPPQSVVYRYMPWQQRLCSLLTTVLAFSVFTASSSQAEIGTQPDLHSTPPLHLHPEKKDPNKDGLRSGLYRFENTLSGPVSQTPLSPTPLSPTPLSHTSEVEASPSIEEIQTKYPQEAPVGLDTVDIVSAELDAVGLGSTASTQAIETAQTESIFPPVPVHELSDVMPGDWAFQSLQRLSESYGCFSGYPDGTFRGNQSLSRNEFAAALEACLSAVTEQILAGNVSEQSLAEIQRLQENFRVEIDSLETQLTQLETDVVTLESLSSGIKLNGILWMDANAATFSGDLRRETGERVALGSRERVIEDAEEPNAIFSTYGWLDFSTSFAESDLLLLQLAFGTGTPVVNDLVSTGLEYSGGANFTNQAGGVVPGELVVREFFYEFPVSDDLRLVLAPRVNVFRYFDYSRFSYYFSEDAPPAFNYLSFNSANSTLFNAFDRGTGAIALWDINDQLELKAAYLAENNEFLPSDLFNTALSDGLFAGTNSLTAELTYHPSPAASIRLLYNHSNLKPLFGKIGPGGVGEPVYGIVDDGFGGPVGPATANVFTVGADWEITPSVGVFGRYSYGSMHVSPLTPGREDGNINVQSYQLGMAFPHLFKRGAMGTVSFVIPQDYLSGQSFLASGAGNGGTQLETEIAYYYPVTDRIALLPSIYIVTEPNNFSDNPALFVFNLRTQFTF